MSDPSNDFQLIHTVWTAVITVAGAIVAFFTKRLVDTVDQKAEKVDVDEMKVTLREFLVRQDKHHETNTARLDQIIMELGRRDR